jgi:hypothetical protein
MNMHPGRRHQEPQATLDRRVLALEDRVTPAAIEAASNVVEAVTPWDAVRVWASQLDDEEAS